MIPRQRLALILICVVFLAGSNLAYAQEHSDAGKELQYIIQAPEHGAVTKIEILALPKSIETRSNLTPESLQKIGSKTVIRDLGRERQHVTEGLKGTKAVAFSRDCDLRRGIIFYSKDSTALTIYYDRFNQGLVNATRARFSGAFLQWVETYVPPDYR